MCARTSGSSRTCAPSSTGAVQSAVERGVRSARGALRLLAGARLFRIREPSADVHEATPLGAFQLAPARGVGCEARARRDETADDHVLLQAPQVVLQAAHRRLG